VLGAGKAADFRAREFALNFNEGRQHYTKLDFSSQTLEGGRNTAESMFLYSFARIKSIGQPLRWTHRFQFTCAGTKSKEVKLHCGIHWLRKSWILVHVSSQTVRREEKDPEPSIPS